MYQNSTEGGLASLANEMDINYFFLELVYFPVHSNELKLLVFSVANQDYQTLDRNVEVKENKNASSIYMFVPRRLDSDGNVFGLLTNIAPGFDALQPVVAFKELTHKLTVKPLRIMFAGGGFADIWLQSIKHPASLN